ncbi:MAG: hypothetical protein HC893_09645 [Chloroflexaceae bacterium]|nr:hypothetical protein [Chloroflexaceae bacterium]
MERYFSRLAVLILSCGLLLSMAFADVQSFANTTAADLESVRVPNVIGDDSRIATRKLERRGLQADIVLETGRCAPYTVVETFPEAEQTVEMVRLC